MLGIGEADRAVDDGDRPQRRVLGLHHHLPLDGLRLRERIKHAQDWCMRHLVRGEHLHQFVNRVPLGEGRDDGVHLIAGIAALLERVVARILDQLRPFESVQMRPQKPGVRQAMTMAPSAAANVP
jgi:hypothetical protein